MANAVSRTTKKEVVTVIENRVCELSLTHEEADTLSDVLAFIDGGYGGRWSHIDAIKNALRMAGYFYVAEGAKDIEGCVTLFSNVNRYTGEPSKY